MPKSQIKRKDIRLTSASLAAARKCLEAGYVVGMGVESALALCAGLRETCGIETADESMFEGDVVRVMYRANRLTTPMVGIDSIVAEKLLDEMERIAVTPEGAGRIWDTLAATVGDAEPNDADLRVVGILRALRGNGALYAITPQKSPRPSKAKRTEAIFAEREQARSKRRTLQQAIAAMGSEHLHTVLHDVPRASQPVVREPGKVARRLLAYLHQGYVLVDREDLPGSGASQSRLLPALPRYDRLENPRYLLEYDEDWEKRHYDRGYGWELENAEWITDIRGTGNSVYCLTSKGAEAALRIFGPPQQTLSVVDIEGRKTAEAAIERLITGDLNENTFMNEVGIDSDDLVGFLQQVCCFGDTEDLGDRLTDWRHGAVTTAPHR